MQVFKKVKGKTKRILTQILGLNNKLKNLITKKNHNSQIKKFLERKRTFLVFEQKTNSFLSKIRNYKNYRNNLGYPVRGQRTHTNAKTKKILSKENVKNK